MSSYNHLTGIGNIKLLRCLLVVMIMLQDPFNDFNFLVIRDLSSHLLDVNFY